MITKTSHQTVPPGLQLYTFDYPDGWREMPETVVCLDGQCDPSPEQCHLESDAEAVNFAKLYGANRATHAITGRAVFAS